MKAATGQQAGMNQQKFEALFSKYREVVYKTAYSMTGRKQEALDIQQTIFLRLIDNGETLESVPNPKAYLCRAAMNEARQRFRTRTRQKYTDDDVERFIDPSSDRSRGQEDMRERLLEALARMEPEHSEMLILWSVQGYTDQEIADALGKKRGTVAVALHRAKDRLKELLGGGSKEGGTQ